MKKRGISPIIATILLVLLSFAAIGILWGLIKPMIQGGLSEGKSCFELRDYVEIIASKYTCTNSSGTMLMIKRGLENVSIKGFAISIYSEGSSKTFKLENKDYNGEIKMWDGTSWINNVIIPPAGEARSYKFNIGNAEEVSIAIINKNGKICDSSSYDLPDCKDVLLS